FLN
ncbi:poly(A) polymerase family protein, partial [Chlamydia psittaci 02DC14]